MSMLVACLSSCGYHFDSVNQSRSLVFVEGEGESSEMVVGQIKRLLATRLVFTNDLSKANLLLSVIMEDFQDSDTGGGLMEMRTSLLPSEGLLDEARLQLTAVINLQDTKTGAYLLFHYRLTESADYSFVDKQTDASESLNLALGPLDLQEGRRRETLSTLSTSLARKIILFVSYYL